MNEVSRRQDKWRCDDPNCWVCKERACEELLEAAKTALAFIGEDFAATIDQENEAVEKLEAAITRAGQLQRVKAEREELLGAAKEMLRAIELEVASLDHVEERLRRAVERAERHE